MQPDNAGYLHAAYAAAVIIYLLYALSLWRRRARVRTLSRRLRAGDVPAEPPSAGVGP
jgi:hypothetical protein